MTNPSKDCWLLFQRALVFWCVLLLDNRLGSEVTKGKKYKRVFQKIGAGLVLLQTWHPKLCKTA